MNPTWQRFTRPPIVVGGCARSGTTLLLSILSCHSRIFAIRSETRALCPKAAVETPEKWEPRFDQLLRRLEAASIDPSRWRWCEKSPKNVLFFGEILETFGQDVRLLHIVRDGRDVITSAHPKSPETFWVSRKRWVRDVSAGLAFADHPQVLTVRYEDLTLDYRSTVESICVFLDEQFEPAFLEYPNSAEIATDGAWFTGAQQVHTGSVARWTAPQYQELIDDFMADPRAVELLDRLGYLGGDPLRASSNTGQGRARSALP
jgi:Sulfotransferase family